MEKVTMYKKVNYYNKGTFTSSEITEKQNFNDLQEALETMKNKQISFVENKKGISVYEELYIIHQKDSSNYIKYTKSINTNTKETTDNIPGDDNDI